MWSSKHTRCIHKVHPTSFGFLLIAAPLCSSPVQLKSRDKVQLPVGLFLRIGQFKPWSDRFVLLIEMAHIGNKIFDNWHVRQRIDCQSVSLNSVLRLIRFLRCTGIEN
jgi:hypothetical protein